MLHTHSVPIRYRIAIGQSAFPAAVFGVIARDGQVTVSASMYTEVNPTRPNATSRASRHLLGFLVNFNCETRHLFGVRLVYIDRAPPHGSSSHVGASDMASERITRPLSMHYH